MTQDEEFGEQRRNAALDYALRTSVHNGADAVIDDARKFEDYLAGDGKKTETTLVTDLASQKRVEVLELALREVNTILTVPAAEYVPAIPDAWKVIEKALGVVPA